MGDAEDVLVLAELPVETRVKTEVREPCIECVETMDARAVFVDVVVRVDVFDCVDVEVSTMPLKRSSRFSAASAAAASDP
jgi:hypothetical protein